MVGGQQFFDNKSINGCPPIKILFIVTEDWFFLSHRLPMARAAKSAGFDVHVATRVNNDKKSIEAEGFTVHELDWRRSTRLPWLMIKEILQLRFLIKNVKPDLIHQIALKPILFGMFATVGLNLPIVNSLVGMGSFFIGEGWGSNLKSFLLSYLFRFIFSKPLVSIIVQNRDDLNYIDDIKITNASIFLIPGSGVYTDFLKPIQEPEGIITFGFVGRLLHDKGLKTLIDAHMILSSRNYIFRTLISGTPDPDNSSTFTDIELNFFQEIDGLYFLGHVNDIHSLWASCHVAVLPSRREGLPKSLLEAAACARPLLASDVPGCREIVSHGENGLLFEVDNPDALALAMEKLINDKDLRLLMGKKSRDFVEARFSASIIGQSTLDVYMLALKRNC